MDNSENSLFKLRKKLAENKTVYDVCDDCLTKIIFSPSDKYIKQIVYCMHRREEICKNIRHRKQGEKTH